MRGNKNKSPSYIGEITMKSNVDGLVILFFIILFTVFAYLIFIATS